MRIAYKIRTVLELRVGDARFLLWQQPSLEMDWSKECNYVVKRVHENAVIDRRTREEEVDDDIGLIAKQHIGKKKVVMRFDEEVPEEFVAFAFWLLAERETFLHLHDERHKLVDDVHRSVSV